MLKTQIESLLFISNKPLTAKGLTNFLIKQEEEVKQEAVQRILDELVEKYNQPENGVQIINSGKEYQMTTNPDVSGLIKKFIKDDMTGELTPASLETLTVIVYRGPIAKMELEQIRGVNCSLIIRNLLIRGLIKIIDNKDEMDVKYMITTEFLKHLGINSVKELPDFEALNAVENLEDFLNKEVEQKKSDGTNSGEKKGEAEK